MQNAASYLNGVHAELAPPDDTLPTARSRRDEVLTKAGSYLGALRTNKPGSITIPRVIPNSPLVKTGPPSDKPHPLCFLGGLRRGAA